MKKPRLKNLQKRLEESSCDAFLVDDPLNLYYLTGLDLSCGKLVVTVDDARLIVDNRYFELAASANPILDTPEALFSLSFKKLGFNQENTSYGDYLLLKQTLHDKKIELVPMKDAVRDLRMVKDEEEIALLRLAATLGREGHDFVESLLVEGIEERHVARELEIFWKKKGSEGVAFSPIVAFGKNSSMPHYTTGTSKLKKQDLVLVDAGVTLNHYHSDRTRVHRFGDVPEKLQKMQALVEEAYHAAVFLCQPGTPVKDLDTAARKVFRQHDVEEYFTHSIGHGIGLEVHELPVLKNVSPYNEKLLEPGMVITIEPGLYFPGLGGIRHEDMFLITGDGYEILD